MHFNYTKASYQATTKLILAVTQGNLELAKLAISQGANVNCRIMADSLRIATPKELSRVLENETKPYTGQEPSYPEKVKYRVPMVGTTTLLNWLAQNPTVKDGLSIAELLMSQGAELGAIDYASYWVGWQNYAQNYFQNTPLLNAIASENLPFAELYMHHLERLENSQYKQEILNYKDKFIAGYHTALEFAIRRGYTGLAASIVRAGADVNPQPFIFSYGGGSPLHMACMLLGNSWVRNTGWHPELGSDLDLVLVLIEHGADYSHAVETVVYGTNLHLIKKMLVPFDHVCISYYTTEDRSEPLYPDTYPVDPVDGGRAPSFRPNKAGQIRHPFEEEYSFLAKKAVDQFNKNNRKHYLASEQFKADKIKIHQALLIKIIDKYQQQFGQNDLLNYWLSVLSCKTLSPDELSEYIDGAIQALTDIPGPWLTKQLELAGILYHYTAKDRIRQRPVITAEENPIFIPALRNKIHHCDSNVYHRKTKKVLEAKIQRLIDLSDQYYHHLQAATDSIAIQKKGLIGQAKAGLENLLPVLREEEEDDDDDDNYEEKFTAAVFTFQDKLHQTNTVGSKIITQVRDTLLTRILKEIAAILLSLNEGWENAHNRFFGPQRTTGYHFLKSIDVEVEASLHREASEIYQIPRTLGY